MRSCIKLQCNILIAHDWSRNKLREHSNIKCQLTRILLGTFPTVSVHINDIRQSLKRVKGNADRQCDLPDRQRWDQFLQIFHGKGHIFEHKQNPDVHNNRKRNNKLGCFPISLCIIGSLSAAQPVKPYAKQIITKNGKEHHKQILWLAPCIEKQARCKQKIIFQCLWHDII